MILEDGVSLSLLETMREGSLYRVKTAILAEMYGLESDRGT